MPSEEPPESYLQAAIMEAVHPEQARATWRHYWLEGLPPRGVERLHPWLLEQARGFASRNTKVTAARAGPRRASSERGAVMAMMAEEIERDRAEEAERKARSGKV